MARIVAAPHSRRHRWCWCAAAGQGSGLRLSGVAAADMGWSYSVGKRLGHLDQDTLMGTSEHRRREAEHSAAAVVVVGSFFPLREGYD